MSRCQAFKNAAWLALSNALLDAVCGGEPRREARSSCAIGIASWGPGAADRAHSNNQNSLYGIARLFWFEPVWLGGFNGI